MSIEESVYKLMQKYREPSYGIKKPRPYKDYDPEDIVISSDLTVVHKEGKPINPDDWVIHSKENYMKTITAVKYQAKLELLNEIMEDNPDNCCISGCNIK